MAGLLANHSLPFPPSSLCRSLCYSVVSVFVFMSFASCLVAVCVLVCFAWVAVLLGIRHWIFLVLTRNLSFKNNIWAFFDSAGIQEAMTPLVYSTVFQKNLLVLVNHMFYSLDRVLYRSKIHSSVNSWYLLL